MKSSFSIPTRILHHDRLQGAAEGALHQPTHTSVAYGFEKSEDLLRVFQNKQKGFAYSRQNSPTVAFLESQLTLLEAAHSCIAFSTGMAAIGSLFFALLKKGDHVIVSRYLFGNTASMFISFERLGIEVDFVDVCDVKNVEEAKRENTVAVFTESLANPVTQIADLVAIGDLCKKNNWLYVVDSTMTSPALFQAKNCGAHLVVHSLTKYIGGHGDALGGAVIDCGTMNWEGFGNIMDIYKKNEPATWGMTQIRKKGLRDFGATISPENAHRISIGMETLSLRMKQNRQNAQAICEFLENHLAVAKVHYPGLASHPQYEKAKEWFGGGSSIFSFEPKELDSLELLNRLDLVVNSTNLGDNRSLGIAVAPTIFNELGPEKRREMGIAENLIRVSVGIEETEDLLEDFKQALA